MTPTTPPAIPSDIPAEVAVAAIETLLKPLGTSLRHYMPVSKADAIEAMQGILAAERAAFLAVVEEVRTSPQWDGQHANWICGAITDLFGEPR